MTPPSSIDEHQTVTTATKLLVQEIERGSLQSPRTLVRKGSGRSTLSKRSNSPPGRASKLPLDPPSRVVPLSFRRSKLKRRSLPIGQYKSPSSNAWRGRSHSAEPARDAEEGDDSPPLLEMTFEWAPRPLILDTARPLSLVVPSSPSSFSRLSRASPSLASPLLRASPLSSPLPTVEERSEQDRSSGRPGSLDTLARLAVRLAEPKTPTAFESPVKRVDMAVQTDTPQKPLPVEPTSPISRTGSSTGSVLTPVTSRSPKQRPISLRKLVDSGRRLSAGLSSPKPGDELARQLAQVPLSTSSLDLAAPSRSSFEAPRISLDLPTGPSVELYSSRRSSLSSIDERTLYNTEPLRFAGPRRESVVEEDKGAVSPALPEKTFEDALKGRATKRLTPKTALRDDLRPSPDFFALLKGVDSSKLRRTSCVSADAFEDDEMLSPVAPSFDKKSSHSGASSGLRGPAPIARGPSPASEKPQKRSKLGFLSLTRNASTPNVRRVSRPVLQENTMPAELLARATIAAGPDAVSPTPSIDLPVFHPQSVRRSKSSAPLEAADRRFLEGVVPPQSSLQDYAWEPSKVSDDVSDVVAELFRGPAMITGPEPISDLGCLPAQQRRKERASRINLEEHPLPPPPLPRVKKSGVSKVAKTGPPPVPAVPRAILATERPGGFLVLPMRVSGAVSSDDGSSKRSWM